MMKIGFRMIQGGLFIFFILPVEILVIIFAFLAEG